MTLSSEKLRYLFQVARENNVVLIERTTLVYLRAFNQLDGWYTVTWWEIW